MNSMASIAGATVRTQSVESNGVQQVISDAQASKLTGRPVEKDAAWPWRSLGGC